MNAITKLWRRYFPDRRRALEKRRLESILRDEGLTRSVSRRIVADFFSNKQR